jgi:hypothetical protein
MKKKIVLFLVGVLFIVSALPGAVMAASKDKADNTITSGGLTYTSGYLAGQVIETGYNEYGYNYQAHLFKGSYANAYLARDGYPAYTGDDEAYVADNPGVESLWYWAYRDIYIKMKWNDAWLANSDMDGDGALDRHLGYDTYIGSGAWEKYTEIGYDDEGNVLYKYSCKIVAVPDTAVKADGMWYTADGEEIGQVIWGQFAVIQETEDGETLYKSDVCCGLGCW